MRFSITFLIMVLVTISVIGQSSIIKGIIKDKVSENPIIGANIRLIGVDENGAVSNEDGYFKISKVAPGRHTIIVEYLGYLPLTIPNILVTSGKESDIDVLLEEDIIKVQEVVIVASKTDKDKTINEMANVSARTFSLEEVTRYSGGRNDASRLVSNFAGVATSNDSRNDIVVRGNSPTGILWRLEGVPIPNPNHFTTLGTTGGPVTALNTNLLKTSDFMTSAFPAEYGNAVSGVFDLGFRTGNKDKHEFTAQMGAFSGLEAMLEGPISKKNNSSYLISYRYSFVQLADKFGLNFGTSALPNYNDLSYSIDLGKSKLGNVKLFGINANSDINFIGKELSEDDFFSDKDADSKAISYMKLYGLKHTYMINSNHFIRSTFAFSRSGNDFNEIRYRDATYTDNYTNVVVDDNTDRWTGHILLNSKLSAKLNTRVGITYELKQLNTNLSTRDMNPDIDKDGLPDLLKVRAINGDISIVEPYLSGKYQWNQRLSITGGLHGQIQTYKTKTLIEPRVGLTYGLTPKSTLTLGYGLHGQSQPLPILFNKTLNDDMVLSQANDDLDFIKAHHMVLGYQTKPWNDVRIKSEVYYQSLFDVPIEKKSSSFSTLNTGADFVFPQTGALVNEGTGRNYGVELTIEKFFSNQYYGLITGSVFQSKYKGSDGIERNTAFNNNYVYNILGGKEWKVSDKMVLTTDFKFTNAGGRYMTPLDLEKSRAAKFEILQEDKAFSEKLTDYLRLDFKLGLRMNQKRFSQQFFLDFQNVTNNENIFVRRYNRQSGNITNVNQIGFFPDVLWRIQF
jgi:hypothetical protein